MRRAAIPSIWVKPKGKRAHGSSSHSGSGNGVPKWVWIVVAVVALWLLVAGMIPTSSVGPRRAHSSLEARPDILAKLQGKTLQWTAHGQCRKECRKISEAEVPNQHNLTLFHYFMHR